MNPQPFPQVNQRPNNQDTGNKQGYPNVQNSQGFNNIQSNQGFQGNPSNLNPNARPMNTNRPRPMNTNQGRPQQRPPLMSSSRPSYPNQNQPRSPKTNQARPIQQQRPPPIPSQQRPRPMQQQQPGSPVQQPPRYQNPQQYPGNQPRPNRPPPLVQFNQSSTRPMAPQFGQQPGPQSPQQQQNIPPYSQPIQSPLQGQPPLQPLPQQQIPYEKPSSQQQQSSQSQISQTPAISLSSPIIPNFPILLYIHPLSLTNYSTSNYIIRCRRCRTYLNCFCIIQINKWQCNTCLLFNSLDQLDPSILNNIMTNNAIEYYAPQEYMIRPPMSTSFVLVTNDLEYLTNLVPLLDKIPHSQYRVSISIIYIDSSNNVILCTLNGLFIINDMDIDLVVPRDQILMKLYTDAHEINPEIGTMISDLAELYSVPTATKKSTLISPLEMSPMVQFALSLLKPIGGTILLISSVPIQIKDPKILALEASRCHIGVSSYSVDPQQITPNFTSSVYYLSKYTGGNAFDYHNLSNPLQLSHYAAYLSNPLGLESVLRIRSTPNIKPTEYHGQFFTRSSDLLAISNIHTYNSYLVEYEVEEEKLQDTVLQCALLHTSCEGDRRIRVMSFKLNQPQGPQMPAAVVDPLILIQWIGRKAVGLIDQHTGTPIIMDAILTKMVEIVKIMTKRGMPKQHVTQFISYGLGLLKLLRPNNNLSTMQVQSLQWMTKEGVEMGIRPLVVNVAEAEGVQAFNELKSIGCSTQYLTHDGVFLVITPCTVWLWMSRDHQGELFSLDYAQLNSGELLISDAILSKTLQRLLKIVTEHVVQQFMMMPRIYLVKETGDPYIREKCLWGFVDDKGVGGIGGEKEYYKWSYSMIERYVMDKIK